MLPIEIARWLRKDGEAFSLLKGGRLRYRPSFDAAFVDVLVCQAGLGEAMVVVQQRLAKPYREFVDGAAAYSSTIGLAKLRPKDLEARIAVEQRRVAADESRQAARQRAALRGGPEPKSAFRHRLYGVTVLFWRNNSTRNWSWAVRGWPSKMSFRSGQPLRALAIRHAAVILRNPMVRTGASQLSAPEWLARKNRLTEVASAG